MTQILFSFPDNEHLSLTLLESQAYERGEFYIHHFPDGETLVRIDTDVRDKNLSVLCTLDHPDSKIIPLLFLAQTARQHGAKSINLIAPYLGYMRQDKAFHVGEAITSKLFADILSQNFDSLVTVDPHLHRYKAMNELYSIPAKVIQSTSTVSRWIKKNISMPLIIGPDEESLQWAAAIANAVGAPYIVLKKIRHGDRNVEVSLPNVEMYKELTPVLVDDIISTANTMAESVKHLQTCRMKPAVCIGIHAIFTDGALSKLRTPGVAKIVTCNTIKHPTNEIDISQLLV